MLHKYMRDRMNVGGPYDDSCRTHHHCKHCREKPCCRNPGPLNWDEVCLADP